MLRIHKNFTGTTTSNTSAGDANVFLRNILVEVVTENYKQMLYEWIFLNGPENVNLNQLHLDPPIRANERVMAGLFGSAITKISERSRPEVRIDRKDGDIRAQDEEDSEVDGEALKSSNIAGRIDYLAWYAKRTFAIELKMVSMNCDTCNLIDRVEKRWQTVIRQTGEAQSWLRICQKKDNLRYPNPVSLGVMVVVGHRAINGRHEKLEENIESQREKFVESLKALTSKPQFIASYEFPKEFRVQARRKHGAPNNEKRYVPFVAFIAKSVVNS